MKSCLLSCFCLAALAAAPVAAAEEGEGDPAAGHAFAEDVCADCHAVEPKPEVLSVDGPRSFVEIARDPRYDDEALREFLTTPHNLMPDFLFTRKQIDDIVAYIGTLRAPQ